VANANGSNHMQIHREVLAVHKRLLGPEHPDTLMSAANFAGFLSR
jgi:hypothetical protein